MARSFVLAIAILFFRLPPSSAVESPTMTLIWLDAYRVFPFSGLPRLREEVAAIFGSRGMRVRVHVAAPNENLAAIPRPNVNVVVIPSEGKIFRLGRDAMAAAIGERGKSYNIFVFYPALKRTLGQREDQPSPYEVAELALAAARVVSHELVHVLAPECGHASSGLMSRQLKRRELLTKTIELDERSLAIARSRLQSRLEARSPAHALETGPVEANEVAAGLRTWRP